MSTSIATGFVGDSVELLRDTYLPRMQRALETLPPDDLWWRPHAGSITFGTILLHLEGNVRQWICSGLGSTPDHRNRASEFAAQNGPAGTELLARLRATVEQACAVIAAMDAAALEREYAIQGNRVSGRWAVYHVVEHFSWHTGQAVWIAKARAGARHGIAFYDDARANAARNG